MASLVLTVSDEVKEDLDSFPWVNWSEVGREEFIKKEIFEKFIHAGKLSDEDKKFCEKINWEPIDEMEVREEYIKKIKGIVKSPHSGSRTLEEFNKWCDSL